MHLLSRIINFCRFLTKDPTYRTFIRSIKTTRQILLDFGKSTSVLEVNIHIKAWRHYHPLKGCKAYDRNRHENDPTHCS